MFKYECMRHALTHSTFTADVSLRSVSDHLVVFLPLALSQTPVLSALLASKQRKRKKQKLIKMLSK